MFFSERNSIIELIIKLYFAFKRDVNYKFHLTANSFEIKVTFILDSCEKSLSRETFGASCKNLSDEISKSLVPRHTISDYSLYACHRVCFAFESDVYVCSRACMTTYMR